MDGRRKTMKYNKEPRVYKKKKKTDHQFLIFESDNLIYILILNIEHVEEENLFE